MIATTDSTATVSAVKFDAEVISKRIKIDLTAIEGNIKHNEQN